ncbi:PAS domain S-box protein [Methanoregula sp.]|uniref:PAS domain S-box protein n=1 Tax=Methanoregula sp. TaxID=2052170 RepID=UPI002629C0FD|nr:PAS domain S-box protein [Methanoregula sp.]MDD5142033.1 PAS domain S-box protein [Methanoregula sp.]
MKIPRVQGIRMTERRWQALVLAASAVVIILTAWCLANGITIIFMHLYYIPITLLAYHYRKKGIVGTVLLSAIFCLLVIGYGAGASEVAGAFILACVFVAVGALIAFLFEAVTASRDSLKKAGDIQLGIVQNANVLLIVMEKNGIIREWNRAAEEISGYPANEVIGKNTIWKHLYPDNGYRKEITRTIAGIIEKNDYLENFRTAISCRDGSTKTILWNTKMLPPASDEQARFIAVGVDITERTRAEDALKESEEKILLLLNSAAEGVYGIDMNGNCTFCNAACLRILGYSDEKELLGRNMHRQIHGKHADGSPFPVEECRIYQAFRRGAGTHVDDEVLWRADGTSFPAEYWSYPQRANGEIVGAVVTFFDITERKRIENALRESELKYRTLFENMLEGFAYCRMIYDGEGHPSDWVYLSVNRAFGQMTGLYGIEGKRVLEVIPDIRKLTPEIFDMYGRVTLTGVPETFEIDFKPLGRWLKVSAFSPEKDYFVAVFEDITERITSQDRIQELLQVREEQLRIINTSPAISFLWKAEEGWPVEGVSENISQFGHVPDDFTSGRIAFSSIIYPDDRERVASEVAHNSNHQTNDFIQEYRIFDKNHDVHWISDYTHIRRNEAGSITHYEGIVLDITNQKLAEEALRETNKYLSSLFDYANAPIIVWDPEFRITRFNHAFERLTGLAERDVLGKHLSILFPEEIRHSSIDLIRSTLAGVRMETAEIPILTTSGEVRTVLWNSATIYDEDGKTAIATIAQGQDITIRKKALQELEQLNANLENIVEERTHSLNEEIRQRRQAEETIRASLDEKVLLLREIHHRVNNNLQIIISLVKLQMRNVEDAEMKQVLSEMRNRVEAMSLVHERLYQSKSLSSIDIDDYTRFLVTQLFAFYSVDRRRIALRTDIEKNLMDIEVAIPLGLILNELISNALMHAFPNNRTGTITISSHLEGDLISLVIADDGAGMSPEYDWRGTSSLGFRLVNSLVDQLGGTIEQTTGDGTTFIILFPRKTTTGSA